jgi:hypothetical protein
MPRRLGPWTPLTNGLARFFDPHDGRTWSLDDTPRWVVLVEPCCKGDACCATTRTHYVWMLSDGDRAFGDEATLDAAKTRADEACVAEGWVLPAP